jgi:hypothetical protein
VFWQQAVAKLDWHHSLPDLARFMARGTCQIELTYQELLLENAKVKQDNGLSLLGAYLSIKVRFGWACGRRFGHQHEKQFKFQSHL